MDSIRIIYLLTLLTLIISVVGCAQRDRTGTGADMIPEVPPDYRDKHMPSGGWTDLQAIAMGKQIYEGKEVFGVNCGSCHGMDGIPLLPGSTDFRKASLVNQWSDSYWFWRISEGVAGTAMTAWKGRLSEEAIWQIIAYSHTFSHQGRVEDHIH